MKAHVALVNPPYPPEAGQSVFLPLGSGYLAAVLEREGYKVSVVDCQTSKFNPQALQEKFSELSPDIVGVTSATVTYLPALDVLKAAKVAAPNALTLMGGPHVSVLDREAFVDSGNLDVIVRGEGEQTMLEIAAMISDDNLRDIDKVQGITYQKNGQIVRPPTAPWSDRHQPAAIFQATNSLRLTSISCLASTTCPS